MTPESSLPPGPPDDDAPVNRYAVYSVLFGVAAFACVYLFPYGAILGVPSITTGVQGRREIAASQGSQTGDSAAVLGMLIGGAAMVTALAAWVLGGLAG
ncbi:hypothetical protein [Aeromicrobium sp.]|uniref:hypothetical protein n=1 Tax=Aeromicrobium sp. TaxID=1871063 RepID=UPI003C601974